MLIFGRHRLTMACEEGLRETTRYLTPGKDDYTLQEVIDSGTPLHWICWLIAEQADRVPEAADMLRTGMTAVIVERGWKRIEPGDTMQYLALLSRAVVERYAETRQGLSTREARDGALDHVGRTFLQAVGATL
jgi:hypothetical protein